MKAILSLCLLLLPAATANAQTIDLLETASAAPAETSPFDLLNVAASAPPRGSEAAPLADFDLLFVAKPDTPPDLVVATECQCKKPDCDCGCRSVASGARKPVVRMKSASWCGICRQPPLDVAKAKDCPFDLVVEHDDSLTEAPVFTWEAGGKWWSPTRPGYRGLDDLIAHWRSTQTVESSRTRESSGRSLTTSATTTAAPSHSALSASVAASVERHFVANYRGVPANLSKPGDSEKKSNERSKNGSTTNANGSVAKSPAACSPNIASASTPSRGSRSSE